MELLQFCTKQQINFNAVFAIQTEFEHAVTTDTTGCDAIMTIAINYLSYLGRINCDKNAFTSYQTSAGNCVDST